MLAGKVNMIAKILARLTNMNAAEIRPQLWLKPRRVLQEILAGGCLCCFVFFVFLGFFQLSSPTLRLFPSVLFSFYSSGG